MKNKILFIVLFLTSFATKAQDSLLLQLNVNASFFTTDYQQNIYFINEKNEIVKYEWISQQYFYYANTKLGIPISIDASNALKIVVFYPSFGSIVILDNTLSALNTIKLNNTFTEDNYQPALICVEPNDFFIWMYDQFSARLIRLDERGIKVAESESFFTLFNEAIQPLQLAVDGQFVYLSTEDNLVFTFDQFGNFVSTFQFETSKFLQISDQKLMRTLNDSMYVLDIKLSTTNQFKLPVKNVHQVNTRGDKLFCRTSSSIVVFTIQQ